MTLKQECKAWTLISIGALAVAGIFALLLVLSRTPVIQDMLPWSWQSFFHKGLVTHVIFSFVVWFLGTMGVVFTHQLERSIGDQPSKLGPYSIGLAFTACFALIVPALLDLGVPELNNYIPVINHPIYYFGLGLLFVSLVLLAFRQIKLSKPERNSALTAGIFLLAVLAMIHAYWFLPQSLDSATYNERLFWGGGHILQFVNTALLCLCWMGIVKSQTGYDLLSRKLAHSAFFILFCFSLLALVITLPMDVLGQDYRDFYTELLRYGLPVPSTIFSVSLLIFLLSNKAKKLDRISRHALWLSLFTYNLGGLFGLMLDGTDTRVPAHYHAVIGGINLAFMVFYHRVILPLMNIKVQDGKLLIAQYWLYGLGQVMHASGMFLAGSQGVPRKTAGDAQALDNIEKVLSMGLMGIGGLIAVAGGVLFVIMTLRWIMKGGRIYETS